MVEVQQVVLLEGEDGDDLEAMCAGQKHCEEEPEIEVHDSPLLAALAATPLGTFLTEKEKIIIVTTTVYDTDLERSIVWH